MPRGERFFYRHREKVIDGTPCNIEKNDVCVEGKCMVSTNGRIKAAFLSFKRHHYKGISDERGSHFSQSHIEILLYSFFFLTKAPFSNFVLSGLCTKTVT